MVKKPFRGKYLEMKVRVSYDEKSDTVHLTSKDKDLQAERGFHLTLNGGKDAEYVLRELLEREGLIPKEKSKIMPERAFFGNSPSHRIWNNFPLGIGANDKEIIWDLTKSPHMLIAGSTGGGKSVIQRNIIFHCIQNSDKWAFLGIDVKMVELSPYAKYENAVLGIATNLEDAFEVVKFACEEMFSRYKEMDETGVNNFRDLENAPKAIMLMIDEGYMLLALTGIKTPEEKDKDELRKEIKAKLLEISRLGRAAGIHLVLATQRPSADVLCGEFRQNLSARLAAGRMDSIQSAMTLDNDKATKINGAVRGRAYFQEHGEGEEFQGYFAPQDWIDDKVLYFNSKDEPLN